MFLYMLLIVVVMGGFIVLLIRVVVKTTERLGSGVIFHQQQSAEFVSNTGLVPPIWREKVERRLVRARDQGESETSISRLEAAARRRYIRQSRKLIHFTSNSSTIANEEIREILVGKLRKTMTNWKSRSWAEITGS